MSDKLVQVLREHVVSQELETIGHGRPKPIWLFTNEVGQRLDPDNLQKRVFYRLLEQAQIRTDSDPRPSPRASRSTMKVSPMRDQMGSIQVIVDLYSHYVPGITDRP
ncbi:MAG: hypothetical protein QM771_08340 [Nitrospira sp.]